MVEVNALDFDKITRNARFAEDVAPLYAITLIFVLQNKYLPRETIEDSKIVTLLSRGSRSIADIVRSEIQKARGEIC